MSRRLILSLACAALVAPSVARAEVEIGGALGVHVFSPDNELGVADVPHAPSAQPCVLPGLRFGALFARRFGVEVEAGVLPTTARAFDYAITALTYRAHFLAQLFADSPQRRFNPFAVAGVGAFTIVSSDNMAFAGDPNRSIDKDTDAMGYAGLGAKFRIGKAWGLRVDARALLVPSSQNTSPPSEDTTRYTSDFEALLSFYMRVGTKVASAPARPRPPVDHDTDKDGIRGAADQCPQEAEDFDGYQDDNGCPDPDNDNDGFLDAADACPTTAEDKDGFLDNDGCPETDNDGDAIADAQDRCPIEAEDKDGFQDDDGCPDKDNDEDGVLDGADKCVNEPETKNAYLDDDGCPDTVPDKLQQALGVKAGVTFRGNTATLTPASSKELDEVAAVLTEYKDVRIEIAAHTDDAPLKKGDNHLALSLMRAIAVRDYLVKKGIAEDRMVTKGYGFTAPVVDPTNLKGAELKDARDKNRRVVLSLTTR